MKYFFSILAAVITLIFTILWYCDVVSEPFVAVISAIITLVSFAFAKKEKLPVETRKTEQNHYGSGDNIGGDKIINN
jgi:hypothetical protein